MGSEQHNKTTHLHVSVFTSVTAVALNQHLSLVPLMSLYFVEFLKMQVLVLVVIQLYVVTKQLRQIKFHKKKVKKR